jgi:hypothetical protein
MKTIRHPVRPWSQERNARGMKDVPAGKRKRDHAVAVLRLNPRFYVTLPVCEPDHAAWILTLAVK